jgi:hypothetical protein
MQSKTRVLIYFLTFALFFGFVSISCSSPEQSSKLRFNLSFPSSVQEEAITGRVFIMVTRNDTSEPRLQAGSWRNSVPFFGLDVQDLKPDESVVIDEKTLGYPLKSLVEIPAGDYYVQALLNVYTQFERADGHVIWAHMDQWEGQRFNRSPGNLHSEVKEIHMDPAKGYTIELSMDQVIPPIEVPADTDWVKRIKFKSELLSEFWGHPIYIGATVLIPMGYDSHPDVYYPVLYRQGHFSTRAPYGFREEEPSEDNPRARGGFDLYKTWTSEDFPRMIVVTFQHPCPYFDDSYAVNSVNCGPYGDAIMEELIPKIEEQFRIIRKPYARVLSGGSTGGWESLALQIFHPDFFGGTWSFCPDPIDFRYYGLVNIYDDENAFFIESGWMKPERPLMRDEHGQVLVTMREMSQLEAVLGTKRRSGQQLDIWQAAYGPIGEDGYPKPLWDKSTGEIDREVALFMRERCDLVYYLKQHWEEIGPKLVGKLHLITGDMDNYYLNEAVYEMEEFLEGTKDPYYAGSFRYGRPRKTHGWSPFGRNSGELEKEMAEHITNNTPPGENSTLWKY